MRMDLPLKYRAVAGGIFIALFVGLAFVAVQYGNGYFDKGYKLTAVFERSTQGLYPNSDVKTRGINIGRVKSIDLSPEGKAVVTLFINTNAQVADTAVASIEPLSIFGPKFIKLDQGAHELSGPYLPDDGDGAIRETKPPLEFTEVLANVTELLGEIDTQELISVFRNVSDGLAGLGPELATVVDNTAVISDLLARRTPEIQQFLTDVALVAQSLGARADELVAISGNLGQVVPELGRRSDEFGNLLEAVSVLSSDVADIIANPALDPVVSGLSELVGVLNAQQEGVPALLEALTGFFGVLADIIRVPGPEGTTAGDVRGKINLTDLCSLILGLPVVCPATGGAG